MFKRIFGVHVYLDAFKGFKSLDILKKESGQIFEHLNEYSDKAYEELWSEISPKSNKQTADPVVEPAGEALANNTEASDVKE